jgi:hypothetical protein
MSQPISDAAMDLKEERVAEGLPVSKPPKTVQIGRVGNIFQQEPAVITAIVTIIVALGAVWGTEMDAGQVTVLVTSVFTIGAFATRQLVTPAVKAEAGINSAYRANPATDAKPAL